jgi:hypothetical protein
MNNTHDDLETRINTNAGTADFDIEIVTEETAKELFISKNHVEGTIPQLNGHDPILVVCNDSNSEFTYDKNTRNFVIERIAQTDDNGLLTGKVASKNTYDLTIRYSLQAVEENGGKLINLSIPYFFKFSYDLVLPIFNIYLCFNIISPNFLLIAFKLLFLLLLYIYPNNPFSLDFELFSGCEPLLTNLKQYSIFSIQLFFISLLSALNVYVLSSVSIVKFKLSIDFKEIFLIGIYPITSLSSFDSVYIIIFPSKHTKYFFFQPLNIFLDFNSK